MHHYSVRSIGYGPQVIASLLRALPVERLDLPTHPGRFTPREAACHLAFWEPVIRGRIEAALTLEDPSVENWDEEDHAAKNDYGSRDLEEMIQTYLQERAKTAALVEGLTPDQARRGWIHGTWGRLTVDDAVSLIAAHDLYHIAQLSDVLFGQSSPVA